MGSAGILSKDFYTVEVMNYGYSSNPCNIEAYICGRRFTFAALTLPLPEETHMARPLHRYEISARGPSAAIRLMDAMYLGGELRIALANNPGHTLIYTGPQEALVEVAPLDYEGPVIASFVFHQATEA